jgi:hypothetical protein
VGGQEIGIVEEFQGGRVGGDHSAGEDQRARAQLRRVRQVVGDHQDGHVQAEQDLGQLAASGRVQVGGRLVQDEDLRFHRQYGRHRDPAALAETEVLRRAAGDVEHADGLQGPLHPLVEFGAAQAQVGGAERDVLADGRHEELVVGVLEDDADPAPDLPQALLVLGVDELAAHVHRAETAVQDPVEVQDEGRLARPVGAEQRHALALADGDVHAVQGLGAVGVGVREAAHFKGRGHGVKGRGHGVIQAATAIRAAARGSAEAADHCRGEAATSCRTGMRPS